MQSPVGLSPPTRTTDLNRPVRLVVGTAGHIDHGKTALVGALTGIDTDRLAEEKRRGISIDLGFAHMMLPAGERISFIDVPGHERFIKNMLAGAVGIDAVLLIVAADESVKPQTVEHFHICRLLRVQHGIIVLTKIDSANADQIARARADIQHLVAGAFLEAAPVIETSVKAGQGLSELKQELAALARKIEPHDTSGFARLPVDRSFAMKGFGTVATGTLWSGKLRGGDTVLIHPTGREARIRALQVHGRSVEQAVAGERTAANLTGIDHAEIRRGFTLTAKAGLQPTTLLDAEVEWLGEDRVKRSRRQLFVHAGTAEVMADVKVLSGTMYARVWLTEPVLVFPGDRLIFRRPSPAETIAGGVVIDAFPRRRMNRANVLARLNALSHATLSKRLQVLVEESTNGQRLADLIRVTGATPERIKSAIASNPALILLDASQRAVSKKVVEQKRRELIQWLASFHAANPTVAGAPIAEARRILDIAFADAILDHDPVLAVRGDLIALAEHKPRVNSAEVAALGQLERVFRDGGFQPPLLNEVLKNAAPDAKKARGLLETLIKNGRLVRLSPDLVYHADVIAHVRKSLAAHKGRKFSVPEFKEWTQISRKYAIPLLEYLDRIHVTRREGDSRIVM